MLNIDSLKEELTDLAERKPSSTITEVIDWLCEDTYWLKESIGNNNLEKLKKLLIGLDGNH